MNVRCALLMSKLLWQVIHYAEVRVNQHALVTPNRQMQLCRSSCQSVLQTYQNRRRSVRLAKLNKTIEEIHTKDIKTLKTKKNITLIDHLCNGSANTKTS